MEQDFTDELLEKLLVKKTLSDVKFLRKVAKNYDKRWFDNEKVNVLLTLIVAYFKKYDIRPDTRILQELVKKYVEKKPEMNLDMASMNEEISNISELSLNIPDDVLKKNLNEFMVSKMGYWAVSDNLKTIEKDKNLNSCIDRFTAINKVMSDDDDLGMNFFNEQDMSKHWEYIMNPEAKIRTLWDGMDDYTNGGFNKDGKELVCFCGQAGLGKSLFLSNLAVNFLKQNLSVVVISLEMSQNVYAKRFDAHISGNNVNTLFETKDTTIERIKEFCKNYPEANLFIKEYPPRTVRVSDLDTYLENLKENGHKIDAIVIDYLNLVLSDKKSDNMYESVLDVAEKLRALSYKYEVPVVTATQANSEGMNNENIGMEHISESRGIAHTVDELFMLFQMDEDRERGEINLRIAKNRAGGKVGKIIKFKMNTENLRLQDTSFNMDMRPQDNTSEMDNVINNIENISSDLSDL